jgi:hypothetical protein
MNTDLVDLTPLVDSCVGYSNLVSTRRGCFLSRKTGILERVPDPINSCIEFSVEIEFFCH